LGAHQSTWKRHAYGTPTGEASLARSPEPRIGPNAVLQTLRALDELVGPEATRAVRARAALPDAAPEGMIPEAWFVGLVRALRVSLPEASEAVLARAGNYTADYVREHRIPAPVRGLLAVAPPRLAIPLLLRAFRTHAWTFAGAGRFDTEGAFPGTILLGGCPTCRADVTRAREGTSGAYYEAAFEGLLRLAARNVRVREVACQGEGAPVCRFRIFTDDLPIGRAPCASS
jgi:divinyl protochlorophyllide a 8-vinyl-reductase